MISFISYYASYPLKKFEIHNLRKRCVDKKAIVLSYDDGPCSRMTTHVLDILQEHEVHANFFVVGNCVQKQPELLKRVQISGHEIGSHSMNHLHALEVGSQSVTTDFTAGVNALAPYGIVNTMYRPPYGKLLWSTRRACTKAKSPIAWWTIDSGDSGKHIPTPQQVIRRIQAAGGGVVLMHDLDRTGDFSRQRENHTIETTRAIIEFAANEDYSITTMSSVLGFQ